MKRIACSLAAAALGLGAVAVIAQDAPKDRPEPPRREGGPERGGPDRGGPDRGGGDGGGRNRMRISPLMSALDTNRDGELSAEEIAHASVALKSLDKNGDGKLTADELRAGGPGGPEGEGRGPGGEGRGRAGATAAEQLARFMAFDKNGDGKLSPDELPERMRNLVTRADTDKDGFASKEELTALIAAQAAQGGPGGRGRPEGPAGPGGPGGPGEGERRRPQAEEK